VPKGPSGQKRKAGVIGNAVLVMEMAAREVEEAGQKLLRLPSKWESFIS
jgi:hypothetical protein